MVAIGAAMVSSMIVTAKIGQVLRKGDEHGYFQFGGSTLVLLFQKGTMVWDEDLLENSLGDPPIETVVKMGTHIGRLHPDRLRSLQEIKSPIAELGEEEAPTWKGLGEISESEVDSSSEGFPTEYLQEEERGLKLRARLKDDDGS